MRLAVGSSGGLSSVRKANRSAISFGFSFFSMPSGMELTGDGCCCSMSVFATRCFWPWLSARVSVLSVSATFTPVSVLPFLSTSIQVAKLAVLPLPVIARAKSVLAKLEAQDSGQAARALVDDLPLFAVPALAAAEAAPPSEAEQLVEALKALHPDEMSPRKALEALYALKAKLPKR